MKIPFIGRLFNRPPLSISINMPSGGVTDPNRFPLTKALVGRNYEEYHNKDLTQVQNWTHESILRIIRQISPEASQAITTFLRLADTGYEVKVTHLNGTPHDVGQKKVEAIIGGMEAYNSVQFCMPNSLRDMSMKFFLDALLKGAIASELQIDADLQPLEIGYVDPFTIMFEWQPDEKRWVPRQIQLKGWIVLDIPSFVYIPVDPLGNDPYGEEQLTSAIRSIIFKVQVMQDLRMAIHTHGWPRIDFEVVEEAIMKNIPTNIKNDKVQKEAWIKQHLDSVIQTYAALNPDANIVHLDSVKIKGLEAGSRGRMFDIAPLLDAIDSSIASGLKTFSVILAKKFGGGSEGYTSAEVVLQTKIIEGFQKIVAPMFERQFSLALKLGGIIANVSFKFNAPQIKSDEEIAQYHAVELANLSNAYNEQAIGDEERRQAMRDALGFKGHVSLVTDLIEERIPIGETPNQPERPASAEDGKEARRSETNRGRRSGTGPQTPATPSA